MTPREKRRLWADLREALAGLCMGGGGLLGLLWALDRPPEPAPKGCRTPGMEELSRCASESIVAAVTPYIAGVAVGALLGGLLALAIVTSLRLR